MEKKPNILFIFPDQMRNQTLGFMGKEPVKTPVLDSLALESYVLTNAISNLPVCSPYRAMMMTGKYPFSNKVIANCMNKTEPFGVELQKSDICWSDILKKNNYSTGYIGKWHLDAPRPPYIDCLNNRGDIKWNEWCSPDRRHGFDYWYSYGTYDYHLKPLYWKTEAGREDFHYVNEWGPIHEADLAVDFIENTAGQRDESKPFALVVSMNPPHMPYEMVPDKYRKIYDELDIESTLCTRPHVPPKGSKWGDYYRRNIKNQYAMVSGVDEQIGRILHTLKEKKLEDDTIVIFTSDHGDSLGTHQCISKNNPYEESVSIPFMIRWPGRIKPDWSDMLFNAPDIYPTLMELAGFHSELPPDLEGKSFAPIFLGKNKEEIHTSQLFLTIPERDSSRPKYGKRGVRTKRYTLVVETGQKGKLKEPELYDRWNDPCQMWNLSKEKKETVNKLFSEELVPWLKKTGDPWTIPDLL